MYNGVESPADTSEKSSSLPLSTIQSSNYHLLGSARSKASADDFLLVNFLKFIAPGVPGLLGVPGVVGDSEGEPEFGDRFARVEEVVLRIVMLRVTGTSSETIVGEAGLDKESYLRSLPRPVSGAGPASVSSQSL